ncbi:TetR/AcrR family transcriptional regulator [Gordonia sp. OPL2]|uniref:TetR/AcrR family transcriptional regulator n=1 Tax=Gordonia sp. OPL2 TaxID=2486274 RepID=UPI001655AB8E|nr:TetR/AcrR family transcriptional regulator [Gordonia sp. OPL2]ROZ98918.1 TetR/AcrR family transcriptional regulator [Gordonia sp. OPL2]
MGSVTRSQTVHTRERRAEVTERVLAAVEELLGAGERFTEIPVQRIAEASGLSRTNFYQYFPNKSQVLIQVADVASSEFFAAPTSWFADDASLDAGVAGVRRAIEAMVAEFRKHWTLMRALGEVAAYDVEVADFWFGRIDEFISYAAGRVGVWREQGRVDASVTTESVEAVTWMVERSVAQHVLHPRGAERSDDRMVAALSRTIWLTITGGAE